MTLFPSDINIQSVYEATRIMASDQGPLHLYMVFISVLSILILATLGRQQKK